MKSKRFLTRIDGNATTTFKAQKGSKDIVKIVIKNSNLNLCSEDEQRSCWFGTTWGWVINDRIKIFGWTIPLRKYSQIRRDCSVWFNQTSFFNLNKPFYSDSKEWFVHKSDIALFGTFMNKIAKMEQNCLNMTWALKIKLRFLFVGELFL